KSLLADLEALVSVYESYLRSKRETPTQSERAHDLSSLVNKFTDSATNTEVTLRLSTSVAIRFIAATLSKRFLILTGLAGSGKTKLAQAFARWITLEQDDAGKSHYAMVPVGADWTGNENVLGYPNGL